MVTVAVHAHHRIAEAVFRHYERLWKPGTLAVNQAYLNNQICATAMPASPCGGGETVLAIGRLLGHRDPATTFLLQVQRDPEDAVKYIHFADVTAREAVETVGT